jgi:hypothetical protein
MSSATRIDGPPAGFGVLQATVHEDVTIRYRSRGMGSVLIFFAVFVVGMCGGMIFVETSYPGALLGLWNAAWWARMSFCGGIGAILYAIWFVLFHLFGDTIYHLQPDRLQVSKRLFGMAWRKHIPRSRMSHLEQVKDGGGEGDSFPSWALFLQAGRRHYLLKRQKIEKSDWLGARIGEFYGIEFRPSSDRA